MTFLYGTQAELIYSMPANGAALTTTASAVLTGNTGTNPPFQLPALQSLWSPGNLVGKALKFVARGNFGSGATPGALTIGLGFNTTQGTHPTTVVLAGTGAFASVPASVTTPNGGWELEADLTITVAGVAALTVNTGGQFNMGAANNAATAANVGCNLGATGITSLNPTTGYWAEVYATWAAASTDSIICTQFLIYGLN